MSLRSIGTFIHDPHCTNGTNTASPGGNKRDRLGQCKRECTDVVIIFDILDLDFCSLLDWLRATTAHVTLLPAARAVNAAAECIPARTPLPRGTPTSRLGAVRGCPRRRAPLCPRPHASRGWTPSDIPDGTRAAFGAAAGRVFGGHGGRACVQRSCGAVGGDGSGSFRPPTGGCCSARGGRGREI